MTPHDIHDFVIDSQRLIEAEYTRIQKRATEDPGTAGDQGEENWASLLRSWLPSYFKVVTKGRILADSGYASPQVDVLILMPSYPSILLDKKLYLAGGVAAAFECKTTLKAEHVTNAVETSASLRKNLPKREGSPYRELNSSIIYGLLAHSHSWKGDKSTPIENVEASLWSADGKLVMHPIQCIDLLCVSDLATWTVQKMTFLSPRLPSYNDRMASLYGPKWFCFNRIHMPRNWTGTPGRLLFTARTPLIPPLHAARMDLRRHAKPGGILPQGQLVRKRRWQNAPVGYLDLFSANS